MFAAALHHAFPQVKEGGAPELQGAVITRCGNPTFGDFQCNNALALAKVLSRALSSEPLITPLSRPESTLYLPSIYALAKVPSLIFTPLSRPYLTRYLARFSPRPHS